MATLLRLQVIFRGITGGPAYMNLHFATDGPHSDQERADKVHSELGSISGAFAAPGTFEVNPAGVLIDSATGTPTGVSPFVGDGAQAFTGTTTKAPPELQGKVRLFTAHYIGSRRLQGENFFPAVQQSSLTSTGAVDSTYGLAIQGMMTHLIPYGLVVYSPTHHDFAAVASAVYSAQFSAMRTRRA